MSRFSAVVLFLSFGIVVQLTHGIEVNVMQDGELCLYANLMLNFSVSYQVDEKQFQTVAFSLPDDATSDESKCEETSSTLKLKFGDGHSWSVNFTLNENRYQADVITFSYNLKDSNTFPKSASDDILTVTQKPQMSEIDLNTCYFCKSQDVVRAGETTMTMWDVLIQAFITENALSQAMSVCAADSLATTTATTITATTTTNATTTAPPATNTTTTAPPATTSPTPTLPPPSTGKYNLTTPNNTVCLLASFALRISYTQDGKTEELNLDPSFTKASGLCGESNSELELVSDQMTLTMAFTNDMKKFRLNALNVTLKTGSGVFADGNANLSLWEAAIGSSYMCNREQNFNITSLLSLYTSNLQVQPFEVKKDSFSTAHECSLDDTSILIPIIVGAALAVLILIVVIAYVIGRRKTYVGYQTL